MGNTIKAAAAYTSRVVPVSRVQRRCDTEVTTKQTARAIPKQTNNSPRDEERLSSRTSWPKLSPSWRGSVSGGADSATFLNVNHDPKEQPTSIAILKKGAHSPGRRTAPAVAARKSERAIIQIKNDASISSKSYLAISDVQKIQAIACPGPPNNLPNHSKEAIPVYSPQTMRKLAATRRPVARFMGAIEAIRGFPKNTIQAPAATKDEAR